MSGRLLIFLAIFFFKVFCVNAQNAQVKPVLHFTENEGLAGNQVRDIVKDSLGILWIATNSGISRFDGGEFDNIYESDGLPSNRVGALALGENNEIYAGCSNGGLVLIKNDFIRTLIPQSGKLKEVFRTLYYSRYFHTLFVGTESGLYILKNNKLIPVDYNRDTADRSIVLSIIGSDSEIYFTVLKGKSQGFYKLDYNSKNPEKTSSIRISEKGRFACALIGKNIYTAEQNRIMSYQTDKLEDKPLIVRIDTSFFIWELCEYKKGLMWVGTLGDGRFKGDILLYDLTKNKILPSGIPQNIQSVNAILYDSVTGVTWLCRDNGLTAFKESPFRYTELHDNENILDANNLGDSLFILTERNVLCSYKDKLIPILTKNQISDKVLTEWNKGIQRYGRKFNIFFDISGGLELASLAKDGQRLYVKTGKGAISIPDLKYYIPMGVGRFTILKDGSAYTAQNYTPLLFRESINNPMDYKIMEDTLKTSKEIVKILKSKDIYYFASRINGLLTVRNNNTLRLNDSNSILENNLKDMDKDTLGRIWCLSESDKLYLIDYVSYPKVVEEIELHNIGIIGNTCKWIKFVGEKLYIATNKGLNVVSITSLLSVSPEIHFYNEYNGYRFISASSPFIDANGNITVHTNNEVITIFPDYIKHKPVELNIIQLKINDVASNINNFSKSHLPYSTNQISFIFRGIKYPSARNLSYRYKINNDEWIIGNKVNLQSLRAGNYHIQLECKDLENNILTKEKIQFSISKPFWATVWFIALLILATTVLVYGILRIRYFALRKRNEEKTKLQVQNSQLQLRSLQIQMNPHFMFNALTCLQNFILSKNVKDGLTYLNTLASIFRTNIENAREEYILLSKEVEFLLKYIEVEKLRFKDKLHISLHDKTHNRNILIPPMLIQPLIENAIKHGITPKNHGGMVFVTFDIIGQLLVIIVEDDGIGRYALKEQQPEERQHFGLRVIQERLDLLNALEQSTNNSIEVIDLYEHSISIGTKVVINLSLKKA